jgi:hypothetical protein
VALGARSDYDGGFKSRGSVEPRIADVSTKNGGESRVCLREDIVSDLGLWRFRLVGETLEERVVYRVRLRER